MFFCVFDSIYAFVFLTMMFLTRKVRDEFTINRELKTMIIIRFFVSVAYLTSIVFFPQSVFVMLGCPEYFNVIMCLSLLYDSSFR